MEYGKVPTKCIKPVAEFIQDQEKYFVTQHGEVTVRKATQADIVKIEAELASKNKPGLCEELGFKRQEKVDLPFEEMGRKPKGEEVQYRPRFFDKEAG
ncbi:MAG: hypothetical protein H6Q72_1436 [Firmicutes bacterium]|nr:hypothetical protein [Bacillota bacterium]